MGDRRRSGRGSTVGPNYPITRHSRWRALAPGPRPEGMDVKTQVSTTSSRLAYRVGNRND